MTFHKSIPERPHGGTPPSWASTSVAAPPARSDPSGARVPPFARAPESRPAFHLAAGWRGVVDRRRVAAGRPISRRDPGELPDHDAEAGTGAAARRARPAPVPARWRPRRQPRRHRRFATRALPSQPVAIRPRDRLADRARAPARDPGPFRRLGRRAGGAWRRDGPPAELPSRALTGRRS